jgi:hypothetical protein
VRRLFRSLALAVAAVAAAGALFIFFTLPARSVALDGSRPSNLAAGAYHVHTSRSDGTRSVDDIAAAAARAGLQFVIFTDHADGTRPPDVPAYRHGVLCLDAVEIATDAGHLVALGLTRASPFPLGGDPADVIDDVHRLGGRAVIAHPDSPEPALQWRAASARYDGVEWLSADSEWRDETPAHLLASAARAIVRPTETIVSLFDRPRRTLQRWDAAGARRSVFALAAVDAHGGTILGEDRGRSRGFALAWPGYEAMFRAASQHVVLDRPLSGDARVDADAVLAAVVAGRSYSVVSGYASPASIEFQAQQGSAVAGMGGHLPMAGVSTTFRSSVPSAPGVRLVLLHNGIEIRSAQGRLEFTTEAAGGAYRIEALFPGGRAPWIVTNPIAIGTREPDAVDDLPAPVAPADFVRLLPDGQWRTESGGSSGASIGAEENGALTFRYRLGRDAEAGPYAAIVRPVDRERDRGFDRIVITGRASRPVRISVQVRLPVGPDGLRFRKSIYLDETPRTVVVPLRDMQPVGRSTSSRPIVAHIQELLIVLDSVNTAAGSEGTLWLSDVGLVIGNTGG